MSEFKYLGKKDQLFMNIDQLQQITNLEIAHQLKRIADSLERKENSI